MAKRRTASPEKPTTQRRHRRVSKREERALTRSPGLYLREADGAERVRTSDVWDEPWQTAAGLVNNPVEATEEPPGSRTTPQRTEA